MVLGSVKVPDELLAAFCERWKITRLEAFGSILRDDFRAESDVDLSATFAPDAEWGLFDHVDMEEELKGPFCRDVDLVTRRAVEESENWVRKRHKISVSRIGNCAIAVTSCIY